jgi:unsaturated rhamnogalacturonyl hydrolase
VCDDPATYVETTLAAMAAYALREAFDHGLIDRNAYGAVEQAARAAVKTHIGDDGTLALVSDATPVGRDCVYATRPFGMFPWGQGPLLLLLAQEAS